MNDAPLAILVTGDTLPMTRAVRGEFTDLIRTLLPSPWQQNLLSFDVRGEAPLPVPTQFAGLVVTGSAASVTSRLPWILRIEEYLRGAVAYGVPVLGICFGHQLLGQALGGRVAQNPAGREIGSCELEVLQGGGLFSNPGSRMRVNMTHVDSVVELPAGASILARTSLEPHAAIQFSEFAWGVQFHPEIDGEVMLHYVETRAPLLVEEGLDVQAIRACVQDAPEAAHILSRFVEILGGTRVALGTLAV